VVRQPSEIRGIDPAVTVEVAGRTIRTYGGYAEEQYQQEDERP
jgi:hypothetical protein